MKKITPDEIRQALTEDILNRHDGAGSDLVVAEIGYFDDAFIDVEGGLDVSALANTVHRLFYN